MLHIQLEENVVRVCVCVCVCVRRPGPESYLNQYVLSVPVDLLMFKYDLLVQACLQMLILLRSGKRSEKAAKENELLWAGYGRSSDVFKILCLTRPGRPFVHPA